MAVRKELLERELKKLGFRKAEAGRGTSAVESGAHQQQGQASHPQASSHPQAEDPPQHGD